MAATARNKRNGGNGTTSGSKILKINSAALPLQISDPSNSTRRRDDGETHRTGMEAEMEVTMEVAREVAIKSS